MEVSKINTAYERYKWAAKEAERLFDMPLVVRYSGGKDWGGVERRMDKCMTAHLHVGTEIASAARKSMTLL